MLRPLRDRDALVVPASGPAVIARTPADLPFPQANSLTATGKLDQDLTSDSTFTFTLHDDSELVIRSLLHSVSPAQYGTFVQRMMAGMGFGGTTSEPEINNLDDPSKPLQLTFHYRRVKEKDWGENRITAMFQFIALPAFTADDPATSTIRLGAPRTETSTVRMQLPSDWNAELPEAVHAHTDFATCDVTYEFKDHELFAQRTLAILQSKVPLKDAKQYQTWYDDCGASGVPFIQLLPTPKFAGAASSPEPTAQQAPPTSIKPSDPKAADLVQQAQESARAMDLDKARQLLDQAAAINSNQAGLWIGYAQVAQMLGIQTQVLQDMERELSYHPEEVQYYPMVTEAEFKMGDTKAGLASARAWVKNAPSSSDAAIALCRHLLETNSSAEASTEALAAIDRLKPAGTDVSELTIIAAKAQLALHQTSRAANTVAPLLSTATDPDQINDITAILAEGSAHLDEAFAAESKIIAHDEDESAGWTIETNLPRIQIQQTRMFSEWDTLALILSRQGKFTQAYSYSIAAIHSHNTKEVRDHLTAINAVVHNPAAVAALRDPDQTLRTIPLGPAKGHQGVIFVTMLLADGKVVDTVTEKNASPGVPLADAQEFLKHADLKAFFPPDSKAHIIRTGFVNCHSGICELVLSPFDSVQVVQVAPPQKSTIPITNLPKSH